MCRVGLKGFLVPVCFMSYISCSNFRELYLNIFILAKEQVYFTYFNCSVMTTIAFKYSILTEDYINTNINMLLLTIVHM